MSVEIARIWVNGIEVGSLPRDVYETIASDVRHDWRLYVLQVTDWTKAILRFAFTTMHRAIAVLALLAMAVVLFAPEAAAASIQGLKVASSQHLVQELRAYAFIFWLTVFAVGMTALIWDPGSIGPISAFKRAINWRIRQLLEVPASGDIDIRFEAPTANE